MIFVDFILSSIPIKSLEGREQNQTAHSLTMDVEDFKDIWSVYLKDIKTGRL